MSRTMSVEKGFFCVIIIVMGVSGAGKSLVGSMLADELGWPFFDADEYHPASNIEKMKKGAPLSESDRVPWLRELALLVEELDRSSRSAVIACSALRQTYREIIAGKTGDVRFVYLKGEFEAIQQRVRERQGHFMHPDLLESQFDILEEPEDAVIVDIEQLPDRTVSRVRQALGI